MNEGVGTPARAADGAPQERIALSVVIPLLDEEASLPHLLAALDEALQPLAEPWEVILVDDGSTDGSFAQIRQQCRRDPRYRAIRFRRNFGQTAAFVAGFQAARGDVVVTMDADMQNDPRDIPMLLETLRDGDYDIVSGWRVDRQDGLLLRKIPSRAANRLISLTTGVHLHDYGCSLKAYRQEVVRNVRLYGELHRFIPALASWMGVRIAEVPVRHYARQQGRSKYGLSRIPRVLLDLITVNFMLNYSAQPMRIFGRWGLISVAIGVLIGAYLSYLKLFMGQPLATRPLLFFAVLLITVGMQFITIGLLGELVIRTYHETSGRPIYAVRETLGFDHDRR